MPLKAQVSPIFMSYCWQGGGFPHLCLVRQEAACMDWATPVPGEMLLASVMPPLLGRLANLNAGQRLTGLY